MAVASVSLSPASNTLDVGGSYSLAASLSDASGQPLTGRNVSWTSSSQAVASVTDSGTVTGLAAGNVTITATVEGRSTSALLTVVDGSSAAALVKLDAGSVSGSVRDLLGVNKRPTASAQASAGAQTTGSRWDGRSLYQAFGVSQVRLHDAGVDLCTTYTAAIKLNTGVSPAQPVTGCTLRGSGSVPHFNWTPASSADADLNNPANYDFTEVDAAINEALATGARIYLRLGESYNGPNDTDDPVAWAKVASNIYRHVIGEFKPSSGIAVDPAYVEVHNEPDGGFWRGSQATFNTLFTETASRVRAAATAAGRTVKLGGAGFTRSVLTSSTKAGNPANNFIANVGAGTLDFYSAHLYDSCASKATLASSAAFLRNLRALVDSQGGSNKPLHISEWNIGLGSQCGNAQYGEPRMASYASGVLTLMQDPAQAIEAAHFYAGMPIMALFDFTLASNAVRINPSAWAFWAHRRLSGGSLLATQVCPAGTGCVAGYAAEGAPVVALGAQSGSGSSLVRRAVVTNDSASAVAYTLQVNNLASGTINAVVYTPPGSAQDVAAQGNPLTPDPTALNSMLAFPVQQTRSALVVKGGQVQLTLTVPAYGLQLVELRAP